MTFFVIGSRFLFYPMIDESKYLVIFAFAVECKSEFTDPDYGSQKYEKWELKWAFDFHRIPKEEVCFH